MNTTVIYNAMFKKIIVILISLSLLISVYIICTAHIQESKTNQASLQNAIHSLALNKGNELTETNYFEHTNKDGTTFTERIGKSSNGIPAVFHENLYHGPCDFNNVLQLFNNSPTHKINLDKHVTTGEVIITPDSSNPEWCYMTFIWGELN